MVVFLESTTGEAACTVISSVIAPISSLIGGSASRGRSAVNVIACDLVLKALSAATSVYFPGLRFARTNVPFSLVTITWPTDTFLRYVSTFGPHT